MAKPARKKSEKPQGLVKSKPLVSRKAYQKMISDLTQASLENGMYRGEQQEESTKTEFVKKCSCGGDVVRETTLTYEFDSRTGPMMVGPASRSQYMEVENVVTFCESCHILYRN